MWKKNDAPIPQPAAVPPAAPAPAPSAPAQAAIPAPASAPVAAEKPRSSAAVTIGASVVIKGEVSAKEDLTIAGRIDGKIEVKDHVVRIGRDANVQAEIYGRAVMVEGTVKGNITAAERIELLEQGSVEGDISAPKVAMAEGAQFRGKIDMAKKNEAVRKTA